MFGFSGEHLLVLLVILLIFGPKRLPDLGHSIGRTLKNFKDAMNGSENPSNTTRVPPASQIPPQTAPSESAATQQTKTEKQEEKV
jgi:sec-independent protein translocase protein TatA